MRVDVRALLAGLALLVPIGQANKLPQVDLGYAIQQATQYNTTGQFYSFNNIRYAAPPTGEDRFCGPKPPAVDRSVVQTGEKNRICPQALPAWVPWAENVYLPAYFTGKNVTDAEGTVDRLNKTYTVPLRSFDETEDCLFLDVVAPKAVFDKASSGNSTAKGAPVLVWIYGGGYVSGMKTSTPAGLIKRSQSRGEEGIVFVALNYRLGALGWLAGPSFEKQGGLVNAGLHDQRFALEWIQKNIAKFGGDPKQVTIMGESGGGGSVVHQVTAYGGQKPVPFTRAIAQSPGWQPITGPNLTEGGYHEFLRIAKASSLADLRKLSTNALLNANSIHIGESMYGSFQYGPVQGGDFVPELPPTLLAQGRYAKNVQFLTGHNQNEGVLFIPPYDGGNHDASDLLGNFFPYMNQTTKAYVINDLYPPSPQNNGSLQYTTEPQRFSQLAAEGFFTCNTYFLERASNFTSYGYLFNVGPAYHGEDVKSTFFTDGGPETGDFVYNTTVVEAMQDYLVSFAQHGAPSTAYKGFPRFDMYGPGARILEIEATSIAQTMDTLANERCRFWETVPY